MRQQRLPRQPFEGARIDLQGSTDCEITLLGEGHLVSAPLLYTLLLLNTAACQATAQLSVVAEATDVLGVKPWSGLRVTSWLAVTVAL